jgi:hypothetical protein
MMKAGTFKNKGSIPVEKHDDGANQRKLQTRLLQQDRETRPAAYLQRYLEYRMAYALYQQHYQEYQQRLNDFLYEQLNFAYYQLVCEQKRCVFKERRAELMKAK